MFVEIRKTVSGTEYWDSVKQRTLFVPAGEEPGFEVTENPKSMIMGVDLANGPDLTTFNGPVIDTSTEINLDDMNAEQLLSFAKQNNIDVPGNMKKEETIRNYIAEQLSADDK